MRLTVGQKIIGLAACLLAFSIALGAVSLAGLGAIDLSTNALPGVEAIGLVSAKVYRFRGDAWKHISQTSGDQKLKVESEMSSLYGELEAEMRTYENNIRVPEDRENFNLLRQRVDRYLGAWNTVLPLSREGKRDEANAKYIAEVDPVFVELRDTLLLMQKWNREYGTQTALDAQRTAAGARMWIGGVLGCSILAGILLSLWIASAVKRALRRAACQLSEGAEQTSRAAEQVSAASRSLAQGASEQAASLEETSASSRQIKDAARHNAEKSREGAGLIGRSFQRCEDANQLLREMVTAMDEIKGSSDRISNILKAIDEIAFQTNILALNAAVEAARAGEAGLGFAVVADEVQNLAQRSAQAAKDTAVLVEESISKSKDGKLRVDRVALAIGSITSESSKAKQLIDEVNRNSLEQARGVEQMAGAIAQMDQAMQQTAANAEESASAAQELSAQSASVREIAAGLAALI